jgi:hypothetical protein
MQVLYRVLLTEYGVQCRSFAMPAHSVWRRQRVYKMGMLECGKPQSQ